MDRETILKAAEYCTNENVEHCGNCPLDEKAMICGYYFARYIAKQELEPASAGTETSPEVSSNDTNNISHLDDTTLREICQEAENIYDRFNQAFDNDLESSMGIRQYGEAMGLLEAQINKLKNIKEDKDE